MEGAVPDARDLDLFEDVVKEAEELVDTLRLTMVRDIHVSITVGGFANEVATGVFLESFVKGRGLHTYQLTHMKGTELGRSVLYVNLGTGSLEVEAQYPIKKDDPDEEDD